MKGPFESRPRILAIIAAFWVGTFCLYWPVHGFEFLSYDDGDYVTNNPNVSTGLNSQNITWAFSHFHSSNWHPLTWMSHMLDVTLFGLNPGAHHLVNVVLHSTNAALLFLILCATTRAIWKSGFVAAIFAWHPLHVESVAWISERKDVLTVFFCLLTMGAYVRYTRSGSRVWYLMTLLLDIAALTAKPTAVTLPFLLLLLDYWPLQRADISRSSLRQWKTLVLEKAPLMTLSVVSCIVTVKAQQSGGSLISTEYLPFFHRLGNALLSYTAYLSEFVWPVNLAVYYPMPGDFSAWAVVGATTLLVLGTGVSIFVRKQHPYLFTGWFWFVGTLIPMIGLVQAGDQARADRYMYLPLIGLTIIVAWGLPALIRRVPIKPVSATKILVASGTAASVLCVVLTIHQLEYWHDGISLFRHALNVTKDNWYAQGNLAVALGKRGRVGEAIEHYRVLLRVKPNSVDALNNLAWHLSTVSDDRLRNGPEALVLVHRALSLSRTSNAAMLDTLAAALAENGQFEEAAYSAQSALELAQTNRQLSLVSQIEMRLNGYRSGKPYRE